MGNPNQHDCSIENKPDKGGAPIPPHQVLAQIAPERAEQLRQITQLAATDSLTGFPGLAVEDRSTPFAFPLGEQGKSQPDNFERFLSSLAPNKRASDATTNGDKDQEKDRAQLTNPVKIELATGIRIDVLSQPLTRSGISLDDVLTKAPVTAARDEVPQSLVRIPGRTDMESALNGLANLTRAEAREPVAEKAEVRTESGTTGEAVVARTGETPVAFRATDEAAAVRASEESAVVRRAEELPVIRAAESVRAVEESAVGRTALEPVRSGSEEALVTRVAEGPVVARTAEGPVVAKSTEEPVVARTAEGPVVARTAEELMVARTAEEAALVRAAEEPVMAKAVEATLSRLLEGASLRTAEESVAAKLTEGAPRSGTELAVNDARADKEPTITRASFEAPSAVPATAHNIVVPDGLENSDPHHHHHTASLLGASLTVGSEEGADHHARASHHYHLHGNFHGHGHHRHLLGNGSSDRPEYAGFSPKSDTLIVTARSMVFNPDSNKRFMTGAEIALGVVLVAGAIKKSKEHSEDEATDAVHRRRKDFDSIDYFQKVTSTGLTRATWIVGTGDTLTSLGERFYDDARVGYLIAQINYELTQQHNIDGKLVVQLFTRQSICLPNKEDLQQFYARKLSDLRVEDLITIVTEREFDRQLVNMVMNRAMGITAEAANSVPPRPAFAMVGTATAQSTAAAGGSQLNERGRGQDANAGNGETNDSDHYPPLPPQLGSGAISLGGFLSYLRSKYQPQADVASMARARLSLRCKF
jgi:hypothetical protein